MTKAIKFNLTLDKQPVRDLEDLLAHFNLDDLLTAYHSQQSLHRWLEVRGLSDELTKLVAIETSDEQKIAAALCELFQAHLSESEIKAAVYPIVLRQQQEQQLKQLAELQFNRDKVIETYHAGYKKLCAEMLDKPEDYEFIKSAIGILWKEFEQLFRVDFNSFFAIFIEKSPLTLFAMLANEDYRQSALFDPKRKDMLFSRAPNADDIEKVKKHKEDTNNTWRNITLQKVIVRAITNSSGIVKIKDDDGSEYVGNAGVGKEMNGLNFYSNNSSDALEYELLTSEQSPYQTYKGVTDGYWKDLVPNGKKCLVLKMENGSLLRNSAKNGEELTAENVNANFVVVDGIDYKSNNANHALIYMVI